MPLKVFQAGNVSFEHDESWEVEDADTFNNPDCIATLSKGENNLINVVAFPTETDLDAYKEFMEKTIVEDGGFYFRIRFHSNRFNGCNQTSCQH